MSGLESAGKNWFLNLFASWTGRILILNTLVFVVMSIQSGSIFTPGNDSILAFGAKEPVAIANGEFWRLITPIFIHIGIIHFLFNSYILYFIGNQLETILGARRFLVIYLGSGLLGNIVSAVLTPVMSAGASSSIFGLLGCGFYIERTVRMRLERDSGVKGGSKAYASTILINLVFGLIVPFIDNAAHVGGLIGGLLLTVGLVHAGSTRVAAPNRRFGYGLLAIFIFLAGTGAALATNRRYVSFLLEYTAQSKEQPAEKIFYYSRLLTLNPDLNDVRMVRAKIFIVNGESRAGFEDVRTAAANGYGKDRLMTFASELEASGLVTEAWQVRMIAGHIEN